MRIRNRANTWPYLMRFYVSSASACFHQVVGGGGGVEGPGPPDSKKLGQRFFVISTYLTVLQRGPIPGSDGLFFGKQ